MSKVNFIKVNSNENLEKIAINDGNLIIVKNGKIYVDFDDTRVAIGGTTEDQMSDTSINPVENKVIKNYVDEIKQNFEIELNNIKKNILPTVLYSNAIGTNEAFDLNDNVENYESIEWHYRDNDGNLYCIKTNNNYNSSFKVSFLGMMTTDSSSYLKNMVRNVNRNKVSGGNWTEFLLNTNQIENNHGKSIYITKVIGYNKKEEGELIANNSKRALYRTF